MDALLTAEEAAGKIRKTRSWLLRAAAAGVVPSRKIGRDRLFAEADLDDFLERSKRGSDPWARTPRAQARRARTNTT